MEEAEALLGRIRSGQGQESVKSIELQLQSRGLLHLDSNGKPFPIAITAAPTPLNLNEYTLLEDLQPHLNLVLDKLSRDVDTMMRYLTPVAEFDPFVKGFLDIYTELLESNREKIALSLNRHDFMYETDGVTSEDRPKFKLVEFNLAQVTVWALGQGAFEYHRTLLSRHKVDTTEHANKVDIVRGCCDGLRLGYELYNKKYNCSGNCVIVMVNRVHDDDSEFNYFDLQLVLNALGRVGIPTIRYSGRYLSDNGRTVNGRYFVDDNEVAVLWFLTFYRPCHFMSADMWRFRRDVEFSATITVPCVRHQLVNMKLFQLVLTQRDVLERYSPSSDVTEKILDLFCDTLSLNLDEEGDNNAQLGIDHPGDYVMKPQREGGGNNLWESEMRDELISLSGDPERARYILMKRIISPRRVNKIVKHGVMSDEIETVTEYGCFSVYCTDQDGNVRQNKVVGPLIRTKIAGENEGGVEIGIAAVDSPYFV